MTNLGMRAALRARLGEPAAQGLMVMFADAHRLATQSFEQRLETQLTAVRLEISRDLSDLRFDLLKWSFVFWVGQLAAMTGIVALLLRGLA